LGARGPNRKSAADLALRGSTRAKSRAAEPAPIDGAPDPPDWFEGEALAEWHRQIAELSARGLIDRAYRVPLVLFCEAWAEYVFALQELAKLKSRTAQSDAGNVYQHPLVGIRNKAADRLDKLGRQFGYSPATKTNVAGASTKKEAAGIASRKRR